MPQATAAGIALKGSLGGQKDIELLDGTGERGQKGTEMRTHASYSMPKDVYVALYDLLAISSCEAMKLWTEETSSF